MFKPLKIWIPAAFITALLFAPFVPCALIGLTLAVVLHPYYRSLTAFFGRRRNLGLSAGRARHLAALLTEASAVLVLAVGLLLPSLVVYHNRAFIADRGFALVQDGMDWGRDQRSALGHWLDLARPDGSDAAPPAAPPAAEPAPAAAPAQGGLERLLATLPPLGPLAWRSASAIAFMVVETLVMLLVLHAALLNGPALWGHIREHLKDGWLELLDQLALRIEGILRVVYLQHGLVAMSAFVIAVPVFWVIVGRPYYFLAAVLAGVFQFIPLLGSVVLVTGMTLYYFLEGHPGQGWLCLLLALPMVVGIPDLVIRPALAGKGGRISPFTVLIGFSTGIGAFGLSGFVLGPLVLEIFVSLGALMLYGNASMKASTQGGSGHAR